MTTEAVVLQMRESDEPDEEIAPRLEAIVAKLTQMRASATEIRQGSQRLLVDTQLCMEAWNEI